MYETMHGAALNDQHYDILVTRPGLKKNKPDERLIKAQHIAYDSLHFNVIDVIKFSSPAHKVLISKKLA